MAYIILKPIRHSHTGGFMKTETLQEFLARGGKVTVCPQGVARGAKRKASAPKQEKAAEEINYSVVPTSLKIALGIK